MDAKTLFAVRATFNDPSGTATHEYLYGTDPTVFTTEDSAKRHAEKLQADAASCDWGKGQSPKYYVEPIAEDDMWEAESIADDGFEDEGPINNRINHQLHDENVRKLMDRIEAVVGELGEEEYEELCEDIRIWVVETFADPIKTKAGK